MPINDIFAVPVFAFKEENGNQVRFQVGETQATYLRDISGKYVLNPSTNEPYQVPLGYAPYTTVQHFLFGNAGDLLSYRTGGTRDLQRSYNGQDFGGFVPAFTPIASFDFGLACATRGLTPGISEVGGGWVNWKNSLSNTNIDTSGLFYNNPANPPNIDNGYKFFNEQVAPLMDPDAQPSRGADIATGANCDIFELQISDEILGDWTGLAVESTGPDLGALLTVSGIDLNADLTQIINVHALEAEKTLPDLGDSSGYADWAENRAAAADSEVSAPQDDTIIALCSDPGTLALQDLPMALGAIGGAVGHPSADAVLARLIGRHLAQAKPALLPEMEVAA